MAKYVGAKSGEIFVGNVEIESGIPNTLKGLKTVRLGDTALDFYGRELPTHKPMFIDQSEAGEYDRLQSNLLSRIKNGY